MATKTSQRVFIWVIAVVMAVGTLGAYFIAVIANPADDQAAQQAKLLADAQKQQEERQKTLQPLDGFSAAPFDAASVTVLKTEVITEGTGPAATADSTVSANYFGWTSDGKIFDSTNTNGTATPIDFGLGQVIKGWQEGLTGVKEGSTVKLIIPADKAYGENVQTGAPSGPLVFIVELKSVK